MKNWHLTGEAFDLFLNWLDADREQAAQKYEAIRRRLILFFDCRGCAASEDLADQTINLVIQNAPTLIDTFVGEPARYFHGVAHNIHRKYIAARHKQDELPELEATLEAQSSEPDKEHLSRCLDQCLLKLPPDKRELVIQYYQEAKQAKVDHRKHLAAQFNCSVETLRTRMNRLRQELHDCILACLTREPVM